MRRNLNEAFRNNAISSFALVWVSIRTNCQGGRSPSRESRWLHSVEMDVAEAGTKVGDLAASADPKGAIGGAELPSWSERTAGSEWCKEAGK